MRHSWRYVGVFAFGGLLVACANNTDEISKMSVSGGDYEKGLHQGYIKLAKDEHEEDDWTDANKFEARAKLAAMGKPPAPEMLSARAIPAVHKEPISAGYKRLSSAMQKGGALKDGKNAALAQTNFDCWMQEAEENIQPDHIAACRNSFYGAMALLEAAVDAPVMAEKKPPVAAPARKAPAPQSTKYVVYFDFDSAKLTEKGKTAVDFIKADLKSGAKVSLAAYADRAGSDEYNDILAAKRAKEVYSALEKAGIKNDIGIAVYGEQQNTIATRDGVKEPLNRRVEVVVTQ